MGLSVGSGVVEAGCKHVLGTRCKRPGMHWSVNGVNAIAALGCCVLSNRFDDFWIRRKARSAAQNPTNLSCTPPVGAIRACRANAKSDRLGGW